MDAQRLSWLLGALDAEAAAYDAALAALIAALGTAQSSPTSDHTATITAARADLDKVLESSVVNHFPPTRRATLVEIGGERLFGLQAKQEVEAALHKSVNGISAVVEDLEGFRARVTKFVKSARQVHTGLTALQVVSASDESTEWEIGVLIPNRLVDDHLGPLVKELDTWNKILRAFGELAGEPDREVTVRALATGSYVLVAGAMLVTAKLMATTINGVVDLYKKVLEVRELRLRLESLGVQAPDVPTVKAHEERLVSDSIDGLVQRLVADSAGRISGQGRDQEIQVELRVRIRQLVKFVDNGGAVEVIAPPPTPEPASSDGDEGTAQQRDQANADLRTVQLMGSAIATLPPRSTPILALPSGSEAETEGGAADVEDGSRSGSSK